MTFTCPRCGATSHHPKDEEHGYCGRCHDFTGHPTAELQLWFDVRSAADQMASAKWRGAHPGNELVIPEHADLVIWLLDQLASFRETNHFETTKAGVIDWKMEAERSARHIATIEDQLHKANRLLAQLPPCPHCNRVDGMHEASCPYAVVDARLLRVDHALAKRVGEMIEQQSAFKVWLADWLRCYATDIFPEPDLKKAAAVLKDNGMTIDSLSAEMGRHILSRIIAKFDAPDED